MNRWASLRSRGFESPPLRLICRGFLRRSSAAKMGLLASFERVRGQLGGKLDSTHGGQTDASTRDRRTRPDEHLDSAGYIAASLLGAAQSQVNMDRMNRVGTVARAALLLILALVVVGCSCDTEQSEGFALYLPAVETPVSQLPILSHIKLADAPLVSGADIVSYSKDTHQIQLTAAAFRRVADLEVPRQQPRGRA